MKMTIKEFICTSGERFSTYGQHTLVVISAGNTSVVDVRHNAKNVVHFVVSFTNPNRYIISLLRGDDAWVMSDIFDENGILLDENDEYRIESDDEFESVFEDLIDYFKCSRYW